MHRLIRMEVELISRETIKPSVPTPPHLTIYPLSFIDHIVFRNYIPLLFFYTPNHHNNHHHLKKSLSRILSTYYPFAGTFRDQTSIHCNDQGASLLVTKIKTNLSSILHNPTHSSLNPLFPDQLQWKHMNINSSTTLLAIQINNFACGGIAIAVCMCHKIGDAATLFNFVNDWATLQKTEFPHLPSPVFDAGDTLFPQRGLPVFPEVTLVENDTVCRRFVFHPSKIDSLKATVCSRNVPNPTRVEVVSALIYKRAVSTLGLAFETTSFRTAVDLRKRMVPPLHEKSVGNIVWFMFVFNPFVEAREIEIHELVTKMKEGLREFCVVYPKKFGGKGKDLGFISECLKQATTSSSISVESGSLICYASWCRYAMYEADFGWGKPVWVTSSGCPVKNSVVLMDTRDGCGIEALVNMEEKDMARFERDRELLRYASLDPILTFDQN
ncbi:hypothetical protein RJT34_03793 [Clitoria ternatea]|uniref:Uncharacterized protein n=1 Tax=Clitoria ternatea TaxID=43366 RepID=A0AAN9KK28_CLITE